MNYLNKLESIKTVNELYEFREELIKEEKKYSKWNQPDNIDIEMLRKCQNANFFLTRVESQIKYLEIKGMFLNTIEVPKND